MDALLPADTIEKKIFVIRGQKVMLDIDLAHLYGVAIKRLNEQVRRNRKRFPIDFMFKLSPEESRSLRSQFATLKKGRGRHRKYLPLAFTEQGVAMLSGVLHSDRAIRVNIVIMRAFVKLRELAVPHKALARKLAELEQTVASHDGHIRSLFDAIRELMTPARPKRGDIGFRAKEGRVRYASSAS
jgi:hypothetical protein